MAKKITVSDSTAKQACIKHLQALGYINLSIAKRAENCDLIGYKGKTKFYFEVKFSSKKSGKFFGCVMLTEIYSAINNKKHYRFIICRKKTGGKGWFFKLFSVDEFIKMCTLTTPILHYHIYFDEKKESKLPNFKQETVIANEELVSKMWADFQKWRKS